jgi:hypothetical protein
MMAPKKAAPEEKAPEAKAEKAAAKLVSMKRDAELYPEGPHEADVHPDEVEDYAAGGWERA